MISAYKGEFLVSPIPLEIDLNYCSHKCNYCFANLNNPKRKANTNKIINQIKNCHNSKNIESYLLANGYPVLMSNKVDAFAKSNYKIALPIIEMLTKNGNGICFQTKGGDGIDDALDIVGKSHWYISISFLDDNLRKKIEPGAPSIESRFELIQKLTNKGHTVSVGINPIAPQWMRVDELELLLDRISKVGINDVWIEGLHLNRKQISNMSQKEKDAISEEILNNSTKRKSNNDISYVIECNKIAKNYGFNVYSNGQPYYSTYFDNYHKAYPGKTLKTHQDFINHMFDSYSEACFDFTYYYEFLSNDLYDIEFNGLDGYIYNIGRNFWKRDVERIKKIKTLKDVMRYFYDTPEIRASIFQNSLFKPLLNAETVKFEKSEDDSMLLSFDGNSYKEAFIIYEP